MKTNLIESCCDKCEKEEINSKNQKEAVLKLEQPLFFKKQTKQKNLFLYEDIGIIFSSICVFSN